MGPQTYGPSNLRPWLPSLSKPKCRKLTSNTEAGPLQPRGSPPNPQPIFAKFPEPTSSQNFRDQLWKISGTNFGNLRVQLLEVVGRQNDVPTPRSYGFIKFSLMAGRNGAPKWALKPTCPCRGGEVALVFLLVRAGEVALVFFWSGREKLHSFFFPFRGWGWAGVGWWVELGEPKVQAPESLGGAWGGTRHVGLRALYFDGPRRLS